MYRTGLLQPKTAAGLTEEEIGRLLVLDIKDADYFQEGGAPTSMAAEICISNLDSIVPHRRRFGAGRQCLCAVKQHTRIC